MNYRWILVGIIVAFTGVAAWAVSEFVGWNFLLGTTYMKMGRYEQAIDEFSKGINIDPDKYKGVCRSTVYGGRGLAYGYRGEYAKAIADCTAAIGIRPYEEVYCNRGIAYGELKQYDSAIADFEEAIKLNPESEWAYNNRAWAYNNLGQYDKAIEDCTMAINLDPKYANPYHHRAEAYEKLGKEELAARDTDMATKLGYKPAIFRE